MSKPNVYQTFQERIQQDKWNVSSNDLTGNYSVNCDSVRGSDQKKMSNHIMRLKHKFERFCRQVPVLGFNSSKYDLNSIKKSIAQNLNMHNQKNTFTIKKNNVYTVLSNQQLFKIPRYF